MTADLIDAGRRDAGQGDAAVPLPVPPRAPLAPAVLRPLASALLPQLDRLTGLLVERIVAGEPAYRVPGSLEADELYAAVRRNLEHGLRRAAGQAGEDDGQDDAFQTGRRRAQQGVPLDALLAAFRLGWQLVWEEMVAGARREAAGTDPDALLDAAVWVWREVDAESAAVSAGYRSEEERLRTLGHRREQALLDALLGGHGDDPRQLRDAAVTLRLPRSGRLVCVVALLDRTGPSDGTRSPAELLLARGVHAVWQVRRGAEVGLVDLGGHRLDALAEWLAAAAPARVGISSVVGDLADAPRAYRLAELAAATLPPHETVALLDERLPEALLLGSPELAPMLAARTADLLAHLPDHDRETLLETVEALVACDWSPTHAAERLHCHRNTVMNRMREVAAAFGRTVETPRDKLVWTLGVMAARQRSC